MALCPRRWRAHLQRRQLVPPPHRIHQQVQPALLLLHPLKQGRHLRQLGAQAGAHGQPVQCCCQVGRAGMKAACTLPPSQALANPRQPAPGLAWPTCASTVWSQAAAMPTPPRLVTSSAVSSTVPAAPSRGGGPPRTVRPETYTVAPALPSARATPAPVCGEGVGGHGTAGAAAWQWAQLQRRREAAPPTRGLRTSLLSAQIRPYLLLCCLPPRWQPCPAAEERPCAGLA